MNRRTPILAHPFCTCKSGGERAPSQLLLGDIARAPDADTWLEGAAKVMPITPFARVWNEALTIARERGATALERAHCEAALTRLVQEQPYPFEAVAANPTGSLISNGFAVATPTSGVGLPLLTLSTGGNPCD